MEKLVFRGDYVATTDKLPQGTTRQDIADFFAKPANRNIFLSAGRTRTTSPLDMTPQFKGFWEDVCDRFKSENKPNENDTLVAVDTEVKFPGVKLITTSVTGVKEICSTENQIEGLELVLVAEKAESTGTAPIVWIFNKQKQTILCLA